MNAFVCTVGLYLAHRDQSAARQLLLTFVHLAGGTGVNAFVYSAGLLPSAGGRIENGLLHITDLLPTFVHLAGGSLTGSNG